MYLTRKKRGLVKMTFSQKEVDLFFRKNFRKYFPEAKILKKVEIEIVRNFLGAFKNMVIKYTLYTDKGEKIVWGRTSKKRDYPKRYFEVLKTLEKNNLNISPHAYDLWQKTNTVTIENFPGISFQNYLEKEQYKPIFKNIKKIAKVLKTLHQIPNEKLSPYLRALDDRILIERENFHWRYLIRKCYPKAEKEFNFYLEKIDKLFNLYQGHFFKNRSLVHGDFHFGNILERKGRIFLIDYSDSSVSDPLKDVANFLVHARSMVRYYSFKKYPELYLKINSLFLKSYFNRPLKKEELLRFYHWQIRTVCQMTAIFVMVIKDERGKRRIVNKYFRWIRGYFRRIEALKF